MIDFVIIMNWFGNQQIV